MPFLFSPSLGRSEESNYWSRCGTQEMLGGTTITHAGMATFRRGLTGVREDDVCRG